MVFMDLGWAVVIFMRPLLVGSVNLDPGACAVDPRFAVDSPLEGDGFEPSVPVRRATLFEPPLSQQARATAAFENARRPVQQLLLPVVDPVRRNGELTRKLGDRPLPPTAPTTTPSL